MIEILTQAVTKLVASAIEAAAKWGQDKIKSRQGVARLLDLHEALLKMETESITLTAELRKYASDPIKIKTGLERRLEPLIKASDQLSSRAQALVSILSVKDHELFTGLIYVGRGKRAGIYSLLPACVPSLLRTEDGKLTSRLQYLNELPTPEALSFDLEELGLVAQERDSLKRILKELGRRGKVTYVDAFDGDALIAALAFADHRCKEITELRKRLGNFISDNFSLKELLQ